MALAGDDGDRAEDLLAESKRQGSATLNALLGRALRRHLGSGGYQINGELFDEAELTELTSALEATLATADLLGRARIRGDAQHHAELAEKYSLDGNVNALTPLAKPFRAFADTPALKPLQPTKAIAYFRRLVPSLDVHPERFGQNNARRAFTLAGKTSLTLREKVQKAISDALSTGNTPQGEAFVRHLLDDVGASKRNPQYSEMVFRTNMMDAYTQGAMQELDHPDVAPEFPAWQYLGIDDHRAGSDHRPHFNQYFPSSVSFAAVRGPRVFNCRCNFRPVHKSEWSRLQSQGVGFSSYAERYRERSLDPQQPARLAGAGARSPYAAGAAGGLLDVRDGVQRRDARFPTSLVGLRTVRSLGGKGGGRARLVEVAGQIYVAKDALPEQDEQQTAAQLVYRLFGAAVPRSRWYQGNVRLEQFVDGDPFDLYLDLNPGQAEEAKRQLARHLIVDALLGNVDVLGNGDNVVVDASGTPWRIDFDRSLAQRKALDPEPNLQRWRQPGKNDPPINRLVYGDISDAELRGQADEVLAKREDIIDYMPSVLQEAMAARLDQLSNGWEQFVER